MTWMEGGHCSKKVRRRENQAVDVSLEDGRDGGQATEVGSCPCARAVRAMSAGDHLCRSTGLGLAVTGALGNWRFQSFGGIVASETTLVLLERLEMVNWPPPVKAWGLRLDVTCGNPSTVVKRKNLSVMTASSLELYPEEGNRSVWRQGDVPWMQGGCTVL